MWGILNGIIKEGSKKHSYPDYFVDENGVIDDMSSIVNNFNDFFVKIGPELAEKIPEISTTIQDKTFIERSPNTIFISPATELEIITIVNEFQNKLSTDFDDIDMTIVKYVINNIVKPLTYIFNLSFLKGSFPDKMKIAKVIPLYTNGDRHGFTNYRPVSLLSQFSKILEK
ncbi:hypothetical protein NL108_017899 [Boleophthalmus pectinirostris]|nr:hypothetical protein NL108_017899 [Boleophthalmus pectinirostris]